MFRTSDIVLFAVMVSAAALTYKIKHDAENRLDVVRALEAQIRLEEDTINLLKADWSLLTQPARLQKLSEIYQQDLKLEPISPRQIVDLGQVPIKAVDVEIPDETVEGIAAASTTDPTVTGGVVQ